LPALRNVVEYTISIFKNCFWYFKASKYNLPLSMQVNIIYINIVYTLTIIHNFININNLDNLGYFPEVQDKIINKEDTRLTKVESNIVIN
jgi:hypothetical protein